MTGDELITLQEKTDGVKLDQSLVDYVIQLSAASARPWELQVVVSPRIAGACGRGPGDGGDAGSGLLRAGGHCRERDVGVRHRVVSKTYMHSGDTATTRRIMQQVLETVPSPA